MSPNSYCDHALVVKTITQASLSVICKGVYPFLISLVVWGALPFLFRQLATFLPSVLMK